MGDTIQIENTTKMQTALDRIVELRRLGIRTFTVHDTYDGQIPDSWDWLSPIVNPIHRVEGTHVLDWVQIVATHENGWFSYEISSNI